LPVTASGTTRHPVRVATEEDAVLDLKKDKDVEMDSDFLIQWLKDREDQERKTIKKKQDLGPDTGQIEESKGKKGKSRKK